MIVPQPFPGDEGPSYGGVNTFGQHLFKPWSNSAYNHDNGRRCPKIGRAGDIIPLSEAIHRGKGGEVVYSLDGASVDVDWRWKVPKLAAMYLPLDLVRHWAENTATRAERLQEIDEKDAMAEGIQVGAYHEKCGYQYWGVRLHRGRMDNPRVLCASAKKAFSTIWDSINGKRPGCAWADNPWVWRYGIRRLENTEAAS